MGISRQVHCVAHSGDPRKPFEFLAQCITQPIPLLASDVHNHIPIPQVMYVLRPRYQHQLMVSRYIIACLDRMSF